MKVKGQSGWLTNWEHLMITGKSSAGKTTLANEIYDETDRIAIAIDQLKLGRFRGVTVKTVAQFRQALRQGKTRIVFQPSYDNQEAKEQLHGILDIMYSLSNSNPNLKWLMLVDEMHNFAPLGDDSAPVVRAVKEGRNKNIKVVGTTQEPQNCHKSTYRQGKFVWLGGVTPFGRDYLESKHLPVGEIENQDKYNFTVFNEDSEVVARGKTTEGY